MTFSTYLKELSAIIFGITQFRPYIFRRHFTIYTDHLPLPYLKKQKHTTLTACNLASKLTGYDCDIVYKSGRTNVVADALSRNIPTGSDIDNPEMPRVELLKKAENSDYVDSTSSESTDFQIRKIRAIKKKGGKKISLQDDSSSDDEEYIPKKYKANQDTNENKRITRSMNNNKNSVDTTKKIIKPFKQTNDIINIDPNTSRPKKANDVPINEIIELEDWINLQPKVILNRLLQNCSKRHKEINNSQNISK